MAKMAMMAKMASRHSHPRQNSIYTPRIFLQNIDLRVREEQRNYVLKSVYNLRAVGRAKVSKTLFYTFVKSFVFR